MKTLSVAAVSVALVAGLAALVPADAQAYYRGGPHGGGHYWRGPSVGFYYGGPYYGYGWGSPWYYGSGYGYPYGYGYGGYGGYGYGYGYGGYYAAPNYLYGPPAVAYIERDQPVTTTPQVQQPQAAPAAPTAPAGQWWYLCSSPRGAYPNVRECPGGWERVPAIPPGHVK